MKLAVIIVTSLLCACGAGTGSVPAAEGMSTDPAPESAHPAPAVADDPACPASELGFTQGEGCVNDGSVEFCLPRGKPELLATVTGIAPTVSCGPGRGRAECDAEVQLLCFYPTAAPESASLTPACTARHGALTDAAWAELCELAALPDVHAIVATWYE